nr:MAG: hypothetical protein DIU57_13380 [Pseudomonadota bacterium]
MNHARRRTSGEIVNATLLEIFLSFIFVVLALAVFVDNKQRDALQEVDSLRRRLAQLEEENDRLKQENDSLRNQNNSNQHNSPFPPQCPLSSGGRYLLAFRLTEPNRWTAEVLEDWPPFYRGQQLIVTPTSYADQFETLRHASFDGRICRFAVLVYDSDRITKREYQEALVVIRRYFYVAERW